MGGLKTSFINRAQEILRRSPVDRVLASAPGPGICRMKAVDGSAHDCAQSLRSDVAKLTAFPHAGAYLYQAGIGPRGIDSAARRKTPLQCGAIHAVIARPPPPPEGAMPKTLKPTRCALPSAPE
ncbi:hypothetical protein [Oceanibium sediminis]|uniref:hypothetical protein n=1 Tax=Oceanibium sediminis TaxID=2026339 RepID=UPI000DD4CEE3|nr:hypothetical protein [Oceanibium sediminis]